MKVSILGKNIKTIRLSKSLSLSQLSELSNVTYSTLHCIENGKNDNLKSDTLVKVANTLGVSTDTLLGLNYKKKMNVLDEIEYIINNMSIDGKPLNITEIEILKNSFINGVNIIKIIRGSKEN